MRNMFSKIEGNVSMPKSKKVCGYTIKKMPIGAYVSALESLESLPSEAMDMLFPNMTLEQVLSTLKKIDSKKVGELAIRAISMLPSFFANFVSKLTDIPSEKIISDPSIGLDGLMEILNAWVEVNNIENFTKAAHSLRKKIKK